MGRNQQDEAFSLHEKHRSDKSFSTRMELLAVRVAAAIVAVSVPPQIGAVLIPRA
jgi:hypothetical protein